MILLALMLASDIAGSIGVTTQASTEVLRLGMDTDIAIKRTVLFSRGWAHYGSAGWDGGSRVSLGIPIAPKLALAPGFVATRTGAASFNPALGLTAFLSRDWLVYGNGLFPDSLGSGSHGVDIGTEYRIPKGPRWGYKVSSDLLILNVGLVKIREWSIHMGAYFGS